MFMILKGCEKLDAYKFEILTLRALKVNDTNSDGKKVSIFLTLRGKINAG